MIDLDRRFVLRALRIYFALATALFVLVLVPLLLLEQDAASYHVSVLTAGFLGLQLLCVGLAIRLIGSGRLLAEPDDS